MTNTELLEALWRWRLDAVAVRTRLYRAPTGRDGASGRGGREQRTFTDCLPRGWPVGGAASPRVARDVQEAIEAVSRSAETGRAVRLPLD